MTGQADAEMTYEQALELLDHRLRELEEGDLSLETAMKAVEDARRYLKLCEARLEQAKQRIEVRPEPPGPGPSASVPDDG